MRTVAMRFADNRIATLHFAAITIVQYDVARHKAGFAKKSKWCSAATRFTTQSRLDSLVTPKADAGVAALRRHFAPRVMSRQHL